MIKTTIINIPEESIMDDLTDKTQPETAAQEPALDEDKLAKLKERLAAKQKESVVEARPAMGSEPKIKREKSINFAVLGSGQAGCVYANTNIYISGSGITNIKEFFGDKLLSAKLSNIAVTNDNQTCINLDEDDIYTVSIDPQTGLMQKAKVRAVWKTKPCSKNKISSKNSASITCSKTHPSLVFRPMSRKKAFFSSLSSSVQLAIGDNLVDTRFSVLDIISERTYVKGIEIDNDIAWLLGAFAGDGSNKLNGNEISFYSDVPSFTQKIVSVAKRIPHTSIVVNDRPGCEQIAIYGLSFRLFFEAAFGFNNKNTCHGTGGKTYVVDVPPCISAAYSEIRASFLAGMIDSDGTINNDWCETSISTSSTNMADKLGCLISSIGGRSNTEKIDPSRENEQIAYRVRLNGKLNHGGLLPFIVNSLSHSTKKQRLQHWLDRDQKSFTTSSVPLKFNQISHWLKEAGMTTVNSLSVISDTELKVWAREDGEVSLPTFTKVINCLDGTEQLDYLKAISSRLLTIQEIEYSDVLEDDFYDLTVETYENYLAGNNGFIFTH